MISYDFYKKQGGKLEQDKFNDLLPFSTKILKSTILKMIPYWKFYKIQLSDFNDELVAIIDHIDSLGGQNFMANQENFLKEVKTSGFSYNFGDVRSENSFWHGLPINQTVVAEIRQKLRSGGFVSCAI
ncbi:hypothetical protein EII25_03370 [Erysipelotrichaceae bacterium OH741_COT-311]|nr:hypothetical protein EII25_03370 [Erysipelotrichaceae bacterium OH741_COT-311]